jgi:chromosomal replication initiator protein
VPTGKLEVAAELAPALARRIGEPRYKLWFERHTRFSRDADADAITVGVPNRHFEEWLQKTFAADVAAAAREVFGRPVRVRFAIDPQLFQAARREQADARSTRAEPTVEDPPPSKRAVHPERNSQASAKASSAKSTAPANPAPAPLMPIASGEPKAALPKRTRRWRRLADFVVGPCNRVAHASALSVVEDPGEDANPLVLHGPVGTGKTHLLEGVYAGLRRSRPQWRITYVTAEDFTNRFVQAMRTGKLAAFRKQFRECDALLVDDLHFLATKRATQEEFLHTFDALQSDGRQMVLTCDCHPRLAGDFTPELTDRLLGGGVWGLLPPDADTRLSILRSLSTGGTPVPDEVLRYVAGQLRGNVRELEGALHGLRHFCRVTGRPADLVAVREALADLLRHAVRVVQLSDVDRAVCAALRLEAGTLQGKGRARVVSHPRMVAMHLARKHTSASYAEIGGYFGGRNHSTAVAADKRVRGWLADDIELALGVRRIRAREVVERAERDLLK